MVWSDWCKVPHHKVVTINKVIQRVLMMRAFEMFKSALTVARATTVARRDGKAPAMEIAAVHTHVTNAINVLAGFSEVKKQLTAVATSISRQTSLSMRCGAT